MQHSSVHRCLRFIAAVAIAATLLWPTASFAQTSRSDTARIYLALGDSLAFGVGATDVTTTSTVPSPRLGYVPHLSNFFRGASHGGVTVTTNLAVRGETSASFIMPGGQLDTALAVIAEPSDVRVVTLDIGGNDLLRLLFSPECTDPSAPTCTEAVQASVANFISNYRYIMTNLTTTLSADLGGSRLVVMTAYNPFSGTGNLVYEQAVDHALLGEDLTLDCSAGGDPDRTEDIGLNDAIACIGAGAGATVVDVYPVFKGKGPTLTHILQDFDIHPTNAGYAQIAAVVQRAWQ